ncbi:MAG: hypothetical protein U0625_03385 [Phycisphaerales bacterium]
MRVTSRRALQAGIVLAALACAVTGTRVHAGDPPPIPALEPFPEQNAATDAAVAMRAQLDRLGAQPASAARDAQMAYVRVAYELLFHGAGAPLEQQAMAIAGLRLADAAPEVLALLARPMPAGADGEPLAQALAAFVRAAGGGLAQLPAPATPETALRPMLAPLLRALAILEARAERPGPAWPTPAQLDAATPHAGAPGAAPGAPGAAPAATAPADADDAPPADPAAAAAALARRVQAFDPAALRPDLRAAAHDLQAAAARAPDDTRAQAEAAADLERIAAVPGWVDAMGAMRAASRHPFDAVSRAWVAALREPGRRAAARAQMDAFARQLARVHPMPLERALRGGEPAALEVAAGRSQELLAEIDRRRAAWAAGWSVNKGAGDATTRALRLARVMEVLAEGAALGRDAAAEQQLVRWGGWWARIEGLGVHPKALAARSALAVEAVLEGKEAEVEAQLAKLDQELPVAALVARVAERLGPWLAARAGVVVAVQNAVAAPAPGAWMGEERAALMAFARLAREHARARAQRDEALAERLRAAMVPLAARLATAAGADAPR